MAVWSLLGNAAIGFSAHDAPLVVFHMLLHYVSLRRLGEDSATEAVKDLACFGCSRLMHITSSMNGGIGGVGSNSLRCSVTFAFMSTICVPVVRHCVAVA